MTTTATGGVGTTTTGAATPVPPRSELGKDAFLQLLVTQLRNQDPTDPQDDQQFIQQLATFSSLEKLTEISAGIQALNKLAYLGATASQATTTDGGQ